MVTFRLIEDGPADAATNMAVDEAIFISYKRGMCAPTLRLYSWRPSSFSIGYSQDPRETLNLDACAKEKLTFVRRPTGGGIIFHAQKQELTYSLILGQNDLNLSSKVKESFEKITSFLILAYQMLGHHAYFSKDSLSKPAHNHAIAEFCFSRKEEYDILIGEKKLGGNAQQRKKDFILQHGSIPFVFDKNRIRRFLRNPRLLDSFDAATSIHEVIDEGMDFEELADILVRAFSLRFKTTLNRGDLTKKEKDLAEKLKTSKYSNPEWNYFRKSANANSC